MFWWCARTARLVSRARRRRRLERAGTRATRGHRREAGRGRAFVPGYPLSVVARVVAETRRARPAREPSLRSAARGARRRRRRPIASVLGTAEARCGAVGRAAARPLRAAFGGPRRGGGPDDDGPAERRRASEGAARSARAGDRRRRGAGREATVIRPSDGRGSGSGPAAAMCVQGVDVRCVLQFTSSNAAGCALHRRTSRVIHRSELFVVRRPFRLFGTASSAFRPPVARKRTRGVCSHGGAVLLRADPRMRGRSGARAPRAGPRTDLAPPRARARAGDASGGRARRARSTGRSADGRGRRGWHARTTPGAAATARAVGNDPSAGSPTETLLRLLRPLNGKVRPTSRPDRRGASSRPPRSAGDRSVGLA